MPRDRQIKRPLRPVFYVFCEGKKTEPYYLEHYIRKHCAGFSSIKINRIKIDDIVKVPKTNKTDPISLVNLAVRQKSESPSPDKDRYWCAFDREAENKVKARIPINALETAAANGIEVAFSNVCFEVWLLLHKQDGCASYDSCDDLLRRSKLTAYYPKYSKGDQREFDLPEIANARKRARKMNEQTCKGLGLEVSEKINPNQLVKLNPYTNFYRLLDTMDVFLNNQK